MAEKGIGYIDEWVNWLKASAEGSRAVVPCENQRMIVSAIQKLADALGESAIVSIRRECVGLRGRGVIDFVVPDIERLYGREWGKAFPSIGTPPNMDILESRIRG